MVQTDRLPVPRYFMQPAAHCRITFHQVHSGAITVGPHTPNGDPGSGSVSKCLLAVMRAYGLGTTAFASIEYSLSSAPSSTAVTT